MGELPVSEEEVRGVRRSESDVSLTVDALEGAVICAGARRMRAPEVLS